MIVRYTAPMLDPSGYAEAARGYVRALYKVGVTIKVIPVTYWSGLSMSVDSGVAKLLDMLRKTEAPKEDSISIEHTVPDVYKVYDCKANVGYTTFETDGCPPKWVKKLNQKNQTWVPSEFNKNIFTREGVKNIKVIPHVIDSDTLDPTKTKPFQISNKREFAFLSIFDFTYRKGYDILLKAFWSEFSSKEDVCLILKVYFGGATKLHQEKLRTRIMKFKYDLGFQDTAPVLFFGDILTTEFMARLYKVADCFVLPHRGEGFGLPQMEAASMALPIITTNWSAPANYLNDKNAYMLDYTGLEKTNQEMLQITPNYKGQHWASPSVEHLRQLMRYVVDHQKKAKQKGKLARRMVQREFHWEVIGNRMKSFLEELDERQKQSS